MPVGCRLRLDDDGDDLEDTVRLEALGDGGHAMEHRALKLLRARARILVIGWAIASSAHLHTGAE